MYRKNVLIVIPGNTNPISGTRIEGKKVVDILVK